MCVIFGNPSHPPAGPTQMSRPRRSSSQRSSLADFVAETSLLRLDASSKTSPPSAKNTHRRYYGHIMSDAGPPDEGYHEEWIHPFKPKDLKRMMSIEQATGILILSCQIQC
jgi:hypothetical protein